MNQEKIGKFIKEIRKNNNLTQKALADKLGVTFQAVSKWETGKNIPDIGILKQISKDFNIDIDEILEGKKKLKTKKNKTFIALTVISILILLLIIILIVYNSKDNEFEFKTISSNCVDFNITGSAAYNKDKTAIYISNVEFCGTEDKSVYEEIECNLYEKHNKEKIKISSCKSKNNIKLDEYLEDIKINVNKFSTKCRELTSNDLFLEITATKKDGTRTFYNIPIKLNDTCK